MADLLNEISADYPCGDYLEYDPAYLELAKNIGGKPEDPITGEKAQPPNWRDIEKQAAELLLRTKDLQVVLYWLRARIHLDGLTGLRDGLKLLHGLLQKYWDAIHPILDPEDGLDPTLRVNIIEELSNFEVVLRPLHLAALVDSKAAGRFCLRDIQLANDQIEAPDGTAKPDINIIKAAFLDVPAEALQDTYRAINESSEMIDDLDDFVSGKVGMGNGPDLSAIRSLLRDIRYIFEQLAGEALSRQADHVADSGGAADEQAISMPVSVQPKTAPGVIASRQDVVKALDAICKYYADSEPSSPVPILLQRAKHLATSDFMQIVQNLLPDAIAQLELLKGPDPDSN